MRKIFKKKKQKKIIVDAAGCEPETSVLLSTALSTTPSHPSLIEDIKKAYKKKIQNIFFELQENL